MVKYPHQTISVGRMHAATMRILSRLEHDRELQDEFLRAHSRELGKYLVQQGFFTPSDDPATRSQRICKAMDELIAQFIASQRDAADRELQAARDLAKTLAA